MLLMVSAGIAMTPTAMGADLPGVPTSIEVGQQYSVNLLNYLPGTITSANIPTVNWGKAEPGHIWAVTVDGKNPAVIPNVSFAAGDSSNPKLLFTATWDSPGQHVIWVRLFHQAQPGLFHEVTWTINVVQAPYIVTFDSDGGSFVPSRQVAVGDPYGTLPTPTKAGYTFLGWYDGTTRVTESTVPTKDVTLKAQWSANNIQYTAPPTGNLAAGTYWSHKMSTTPGVVISITGAGTSWIQVNEGTLSGVPPSEGVYEVSVLLTAPNHISQSQSFTLNVVPQLVLTNSPAAGAIAYVVG
jgi:uncharacterized repeat protein (TIGR02543 family)